MANAMQRRRSRPKLVSRGRGGAKSAKDKRQVVSKVQGGDSNSIGAIHNPAPPGSEF